MYLSDRDIRWAIERNALIIPDGSKIDPTSIDLKLDSVEKAQVWDVDAFQADQKLLGVDLPEVRIAKFNYPVFAEKYQISPPEDPLKAVFRRGKQVVVKPGGFLLWPTKGKVGTPAEEPRYICFVDGKSTRARTGILVHFTAPTIHAGWAGNVVLEIANLGPFSFVLEEDDCIAQLTVAQISSTPELTHVKAGSSTQGQTSNAGKRPSG